MPDAPLLRMSELAQRLGVASSTVSRALRGDARIGAKTTQRVREMADTHGYRPNPLVSALMANRRGRSPAGAVDVIALVTQYGGSEDWRTKDVCRWEYEGILQRAGELGYRIEVFSLGEYSDDVGRLADTLRARGIRGVLLGFSREGKRSAIFDTAGFAAAGLSAYFPTTTVDRANFHGFYNVQLALDRIVDLGYRRPALVVPELNNSISNNLWSGAFLDWQRRLPVGDRCELFVPSSAIEAASFNEWLQRNQPDCLLVYKVQVGKFLAREGWRVPEDIGLANLYRTVKEMQLTAGIDGNLSAVGAAALDLVVERLNTNRLGTAEHPKEVLIKGRWCDGTTLPRCRDQGVRDIGGRLPRAAS